MSESFYYGTDSELRATAPAFANAINSAYEAYGVSLQQAEEIQGLTQAYAEAFDLISDPKTRTRPAVQRKNAARKALKDAARRLGNLIIANPEVTDAQLVKIGLKMRIGRSRIPAPESTPRIVVHSMVGHRIELTIRGENAGRGKPTGVAGASIWYCTEDAESGKPNAWTWIANTSRTNTSIEIPAAVPPGTKVWICAAWFNNRQETGDRSNPMYAYVQFGGSLRIPQLAREAA